MQHKHQSRLLIKEVMKSRKQTLVVSRKYQSRDMVYQYRLYSLVRAIAPAYAAMECVFIDLS